MKNIYVLALSLAMVALGFSACASKVYAQDNQVNDLNAKVSQVNNSLYVNGGDFKNQVMELYVKTFQVNNWLNYESQTDIYPHATGYYDDMVDHYEADQLMLDSLSDGLGP